MILSLVSLASVSFLPWVAPGSHKTCDDVNRAVRFRWDANERPYHESKEVGLGGGIEWALHPSFCVGIHTQLRGRRVDCSTLTKAVKHALEFWSDRHPDLYFVQVNDTKAASSDRRSIQATPRICRARRRPHTRRSPEPQGRYFQFFEEKNLILVSRPERSANVWIPYHHVECSSFHFRSIIITFTTRAHISSKYMIARLC